MVATPHLSRYTAMVTHLAKTALDAAERWEPEEGPSMAIGLEAARALVTPEAEPVSLQRLWQSGTRYDDSIGHTRPTYFALLIHLHAQAGADPQTIAQLVDKLETPPDTAGQLWRAVGLVHASRFEEARQIVDPIVQKPGPEGEVAAFITGEDLLDVWWYRELVSLHALFYLAYTSPLACPAWQSRAQDAVLYHLENTQPDHTTAQPWAVAAFLHNPQAIPFGEQQLHDAQSYWTHGPAGSSLVPGLLLADAACTMQQLLQEAVEP